MLKHRTTAQRQKNPWKAATEMPKSVTEWVKISKEGEKRLPWAGLTPAEAYRKGQEDARREDFLHKLKPTC